MRVHKTNAGNLIKYLENFEPDELVVFLLADVENRRFMKYGNVMVMTDTGHPVIALDIEGSVPFDEALTNLVVEAERLEAAN